jgi:protein O-mannosyl-transferase
MAIDGGLSPAAGRAGFDWQRGDRIALTLLLAWVAICYAQTLGFNFVNWDDIDLVLHNPLVLNPAGVPFLHRLTTPEAGYPIPVTLLSYRLEYLLAGFDHPWLQHAVNVVVHLASTALLFRIARTIGLGTAAAALACALFGLHPAAAEPVSWLTGRKDVLALFFALATVTLALRKETPAPRGARVARGLTFVLAILSKPVAVALVPTLILIAAARTGRDVPWSRRIGKAAWANLPEIAITVALLPVAYLTHLAFGGLREGEEVASSLRMAWYGAGAHLAIATGLEPPCVRHLLATVPPPFSPRFDLLPAGAALGVFILTRLRNSALRALSLAAAATALFAYLPSSGLIPMRRFIADSYVYPALPGLGLAVAAVFENLLASVQSRFALLRRALVPAVAIGLGLLAIPSSGRFRTTSDLWADAMEHYPDLWQPCRNWAVAMQEIGGPARALEATDQCIARFGAANFEKNRAVALFELGRKEEAADWMRRALAREPNEKNAPPGLLDLVGIHPTDKHRSDYGMMGGGT